MLNPFTMKNLIILFTIYFASHYIFFTLFFIIWVKLFYLSCPNLGVAHSIVKNPFVKILINGFFISPNRSQKCYLEFFISNNIIMNQNAKILTSKNFSSVLCTHLCTYLNPTYLVELLTEVLKINIDSRQKINKICSFKIKKLSI